LAAVLMCAPRIRNSLWVSLPWAAVVGTALIMSDTRGIWIATVAAGAYLLWRWNKWAAAAMPVLLAIGLAAAPAAVQARAWSIIHPETQTDSNGHRIVCWRTGWRMIQAHPILGVGPEIINRRKVF